MSWYIIHPSITIHSSHPYLLVQYKNLTMYMGDSQSALLYKNQCTTERVIKSINQLGLHCLALLCQYRGSRRTARERERECVCDWLIDLVLCSVNVHEAQASHRLMRERERARERERERVWGQLYWNEMRSEWSVPKLAPTESHCTAATHWFTSLHR